MLSMQERVLLFHFPLLPSLIYAKQKRHVPYRLYPMFKPWDKVKANVNRNTSILYMKYVVWNCQWSEEMLLWYKERTGDGGFEGENRREGESEFLIASGTNGQRLPLP